MAHLKNNNWAVVVAQLAEWLPLILEVCGSNPIICTEHHFYC